MSVLKQVTKNALEALEEVLPKIAKQLGTTSRKNMEKIKAMARAIRDKDLELARSVRRQDVPGHRRTEIDVSVRPFRRRRGHDPVEFDNQLSEQLDTLQDMNMLEWITNRGRYLDGGRSSASQRAQRDARADALINKITELRDAGQSRADAAANANDWLASQAALHRLDGIAGGDPTDISRVGDARVNASIGSQWRSRHRDRCRDRRLRSGQPRHRPLDGLRQPQLPGLNRDAARAPHDPPV